MPAPQAPEPPASGCLSCGATTDLDAVHIAAREGIAARVEHYCHDPGACCARRHAHQCATSGPPPVTGGVFDGRYLVHDPGAAA
jgi:hypothetical protein